MLNVIFRFLDEDNKEKVSIGSYWYFKQRMKTARQLIEFMWWECADKDRQELVQMNGEELAKLLCDTLEWDVLHCIHPN